LNDIVCSIQHRTCAGLTVKRPKAGVCGHPGDGVAEMGLLIRARLPACAKAKQSMTDLPCF